ncbi:MAG: YjbQ family protein [Deltaproteobacteria bacterium]|nr:YjbQ family protein [Deltaproteobacteria bacterium]
MKNVETPYSSLSGVKTFFKTIDVITDQNNLLQLEPNLSGHVDEYDYFYLKDFTEEAFQWVEESGIQNGFLTIQAMHTTCVIAINELDEPCLLGDMSNAVRASYPKGTKYLHNSSLRTKNLCEEDNKCDRNADAHLKSFLFGSPSQLLIVRDGKPLFGRWQRLCLIDFDGPRRRQVAIQVLGE